MRATTLRPLILNKNNCTEFNAIEKQSEGAFIPKWERPYEIRNGVESPVLSSQAPLPRPGRKAEAEAGHLCVADGKM